MFNKMKLGSKLIIAFLAVGVIPFAIIALTSLNKASNALSYSAFNQLEGVRGIKKGQIEQFFTEREGDIGVLMETVGTLRLEAFDKLEAIQEQKKLRFLDYMKMLRVELKTLQGSAFIRKALTEFDQAFEAEGDTVDSLAWQSLAKKYDKRLTKIMADNGWYDLFLIHTDGDIVYTATKESDLGMIIPDSILRDSPLGKAFKVAQNNNPEEIAFADFAPYAPSNGEPAGFMMGKMIDENSEVIGYIAMQIPVNHINEIMMSRAGMGKTGETYLVGQDNLMRSDSFLDPEGHSVKASFKNNTKVDTEGIRDALAGNENQDVIIDYNGNPVLSCWDSIDLGNGVHWAMLSEMDVAEAFSPVDENGNEYYKKYIEKYGYYDLFLFNPDGMAFYTATKEADYQTNFANGKYASSNLGKLFREVMQTKKFGIADFAPYAPSNDAPSAFIAQPVTHNGDVEIVVGLQLSLDAINNVMQQRDGMGETGETYLVGSDKLMRSDSFLDPTNHSVKASFANPSRGNVDTEAARDALSGKTASKIITDYNGNSVLSAYAPLKIGDATWALIAEIDESEAFAAVKALKMLIVVVFIVGIILIVILAVFIARAITKPVGKAVDMLGELEMGHIDKRLNMNSHDEIGIMANSMDSFADDLQNNVVASLNMLANGDLTFETAPKDSDDAIGTALQKTGEDLNSMIMEIQMASEQIATGSGQVSDASQSLSQGASESAASLEQITSSMTEMAAQTKTNAENSGQANQLSGEARNAAEKGNGHMTDLVKAIDEINESGQNISKIIKVIDEIAFQTNLLALNAAVEAARAGKHGKGFAVVAEEVRNLAARSAKAAQETAELIEGSVEKAKNGSEIAGRTSEALAEIVSGATKVTDLVGEIAAASNEQAQGISQVNQGLTQIEQVTQTNTASAEECAAAAEELSSQALHMQDMMAKFKIKGASTTKRTLPGNQRALPHPKEEGHYPQPSTSDNPNNVISLDDEEFGKY
jgi:methyl-accepting chemotaxis protein